MQEQYYESKDLKRRNKTTAEVLANIENRVADNDLSYASSDGQAVEDDDYALKYEQ